MGSFFWRIPARGAVSGPRITGPALVVLGAYMLFDYLKRRRRRKIAWFDQTISSSYSDLPAGSEDSEP